MSNTNDKMVWMTRGIEGVMLMVSLLWAGEVNAQKPQTTPKRYTPSWSFLDPHRKPTALISPSHKSKSEELSREQSARLMKSGFNSSFLFARSDGLLAPESLFAGEALGSSFKGSPFYISTSMEVFRFPSLK